MPFAPKAQANNLLDAMIDKIGLRNDAALARQLQVAPPVISKMRSGKIPVGAGFLIRCHYASGLSIAALKELASLPPGLRSLSHTVEA